MGQTADGVLEADPSGSIREAAVGVRRQIRTAQAAASGEEVETSALGDRSWSATLSRWWSGAAGR